MTEDEKKSHGARPEEFDVENREWLESLDYIYENEGPERVEEIIQRLRDRAQAYGVRLNFPGSSPYINTVPVSQQPAYPGDRATERRIKSIIRWNAMAMVVRANRRSSGIGGHISTYGSAATLLEVGFNHFFRGPGDNRSGDLVYFQGHAAPGIYARAFLEGRIDEKHLENFRRELADGGGLSSYPHPRLMPDFWEFPTVSMGLTSISAIYHARFMRYLENRGILETSGRRVWAFLGDGEMDEPESMGSITLAARERLDNLTFVINCNLQRLDGPVRGNGKIIQELEAAFRGAGWNVIKVIWGSDWDKLLDADEDGLLIKRMSEVVDGQFQKYATEDGAYVRKDFFGADPRLLKLVENLSDEQIRTLNRGGHDPAKVYSAYQSAVAHKGQPTVVLAYTVKGYGLGESGEGRNITHSQKKLNEEELKQFRDKFGISISDEDVAAAPFYRPSADSAEYKYLIERRESLGGFLPARRSDAPALQSPAPGLFEEFIRGTGDREAATTMVFVHMLSRLLKDKNIGRNIVPIVPDEARTFGMESLFRQVGIYSSLGQQYEPVDADSLLFYKEAVDGAILEEGISEAGAMSSFIAAGTSYATHGINMIPFFIYYSMFGFQRVGDLIWAAADQRARGFLLGGTAGRTTLAGEGLQHQDGQSHLLAYPVPTLKAYDPAFAYELAVIVREGIRRMFEQNEDLFYYITVMNESYVQPPMPEGVEDGILKGIYKYATSQRPDAGAENGRKVHLMGSGTILNQAIEAKSILEDRFDIPADVYSVTSYKELYWDALETDRWNLLNPRDVFRLPYISRVLGQEKGVFVAASDYVQALPASLSKWIPGWYEYLGTDGFGRSEDRAALRDFFEVDARYIALAGLLGLVRAGKLETGILKKAVLDLGIDPDKKNPLVD
jgi:pyruvate dehydrogenase E1 component